MFAACAVLVMCDVLNPDGSPHETNTRAKLADLLTSDITAQQPLYGFEQARGGMHLRADNSFVMLWWGVRML